MALNWNIGNIKDHDKLWIKADGRDQLNGLTEALIWTCMAVNLGTITEANIPEWCWRLAYLEECGRSFLREKDGFSDEAKERNFTVAELRRHIGLTTNVTTETRAKFVRSVTDHLRREADWRQRRMLEGREDAAA